MKRRNMPPKDTHIVKIAVELENHHAQLINLDQRLPLSGKIQEICNTWAIVEFENYSLQFGEQNNYKYVTEKNRNEIKNGSVLRLEFSPTKIANDTLQVLTVGSNIDKVKCLKNLVTLCMDLTFALEFINEKGLDIIINIIEDKQLEADQEILKYSLATFVELMEHDTVSWEGLEHSFIQRNIHIVCSFNEYQKECLESALSNLENIVQHSTKHGLIESDVSLDILLYLLQGAKSPTIIQNCIALINALFIKADDLRKRQIAQVISTKPFRIALISNVSGTEMMHQLYVLQTLSLGLLEDRMHGIMFVNEQDIQNKIKELRRIAFDDCSGVMPLYDDQKKNANLSGGPNVNYSHFYKLLGFVNECNPIQDFNEVPPGVLALNCMVYFARNYPQQYTKIVHENSCRSSDHEWKFCRSSIELVKLLCEILHIGEPPSDLSIHFQPMFFTHETPFEEFFCISIMALNRTWRDMRATNEDFQKVFSVVREQISRSLKDRPDNYEDFRTKISQFTYQKITNLRQQERTSKEECDSTASAIVKLKEKVGPQIIDLIKQQRLSFLVQGTRFSKYSRGTRSKDKFWYSRLSPNHKFIHYGDCDEKTIPSLEELTHKVSVYDIKQLLEGKECPHMKDNRTRKSAVNLAFSITFDNTVHSTLDFVAPDETIFNYWTDGINALLGLRMLSKQMKEDYDTLLSMEIKLRLLDTEGVDISTDSPPIPDIPDNYQFCFND